MADEGQTMNDASSTAEPAGGAEPKIGLALGGGAELGLAHIGVLEVLESHGIFASYVGGSSAGALVGAFYAAGTPLATMRYLAARMTWRMLQRMTLPILALSTNKPLLTYLKRMLPVKDFASLRMPLRLVTTDLLTAEMVVFEGGPGLVPRGTIDDPDIVFTTGDLAQAVRASCARPIINRPVQIGDRILVDGCLTNNVPAWLVRDMGADVVVAVDLISGRRRSVRPKNILSYAVQAEAIHMHWSLKSRHIAADIVIRPDFSALPAVSFSVAEDAIGCGAAAAEAAMPAIRKAIAERS